MTIDSRQVAAGMLEAVPFARTLGIEFVEVAPEAEGGVRVTVRLPDSPATHNHVGGPHAGAMFTLGETASGAVVLAAFGQLLDRAVPLAVTGRDRATGSWPWGRCWPPRGSAGRPPRWSRNWSPAGGRSSRSQVEIATEEGKPTGEMTVVWTLRPN